MSRQTWFHLLLLYGLLVGLAFVTPAGSNARAPRPMSPKSITNSIGMEFVRIPSGRFTMGSPASEEPRCVDEEQWERTIRKEFWMGVHEVTQKQFKDVMGYNPSFFSRDGKDNPELRYRSYCQPAGGKGKVPADTSSFPIENVSYAEAREFCQKLMARKDEHGHLYRLPRDAEWEYTCRGNAPSYQVFHFGNSLSSRQANFDGRDSSFRGEKGFFLERTCKVGSYAKNRFGLYDMHGNVAEWCDGYDGNRSNIPPPPKDLPPLPPSEPGAVVRGGCWKTKDYECRSADRSWYGRTARTSEVGFRVVLVPSGK
jgi:formylglycine-generating enzyme required for sulfatase activity